MDVNSSSLDFKRQRCIYPFARKILPYDCKGFKNEVHRLVACLPRYKCLPCKLDHLSSVHKSQM